MMYIYRCLIVALLVTIWPGVALAEPKGSPFKPQFIKNDSQYLLEWEYKDVPFEFEVYRAPLAAVKRVSETKVVNRLGDITKNPVGKSEWIPMNARDVKVFYLVARNKSAESVRFAVAPHETNPEIATLGFAFDCLCNGHTYEIPPGKFWYRIIRLEAFEAQENHKVRLKHTVFRVKK